MKMASTLL
jgi:hypothetical protein